MIIYKYIMKAHVGPFIFSVFTLMSVFLLQFFMKFADKLIGKGLSSWVIIQLVTYNLAWMLILVIPMSVLISTLMAFGKLAQDNEIAVLKASGMSLYKIKDGKEYPQQRGVGYAITGWDDDPTKKELELFVSGLNRFGRGET